MAGPPKQAARHARGRRGEKAFAVIAIALVVLSAGLLLSLLLTSGGEAGFGGSRDRDRQDHDGTDPHDDHADHGEEHAGPAPRQRQVFFTGPMFVSLTLGYLALLALWAGVRARRAHRKEER